MHLEFTIVQCGSLGDLRRLVWAVNRRDEFKRSLLILALTPGVCWIIRSELGELRFWSERFDLGLGVVALSVALLLIVQPLAANDVKVRRNFRRPFPPAPVIVTDEDFTVEQSGRARSTRWDDVTLVQERADHMIIRSGHRTAMLCGRCAGPEKFAEFRTFLVGRGLLPAAHKIES